MSKLLISFLVVAVWAPLLSNASALAGQKEDPDGKPAVVCSTRFVDNGNGTVTDTKRNLMWQKLDSGQELAFDQAVEYARKLGLGGYSDWRLPKPDEPDTAVVKELMLPVHSPAAYARFDLYWSSDPEVLLPFNYRPSSGVEVSRAYPAGKADRAFVRAVRSLKAAGAGH